MTELSVGIIIAVTVSSVVFAVLLIIVVVYLCLRGKESITLKDNFDGVSQSSFPGKLYIRRKRSTVGKSEAYLHTPPRLKRGRIWLTRASRDVYHIDQKKQDQSNQNNVVGQRITRSSLTTSNVPVATLCEAHYPTPSPYQGARDTGL